jgi:alpha-L-fucosidase 2
MRSVLLALLLVAAVARVAVADDCLPLTPRNPDGNYIIPGVLGDIVYRRVAGHELALDAYAQPGDRSRPLVIVVHGGGLSSGSRVSFVGQLLETLTEAGFNWASIDYRLQQNEGRESFLTILRKDSRPLLEAVDDVDAAIGFVRCHAQALRTDPNRIVLLGEEAGAQIAALAAARQPPGLAASVLLGGYYDLRDGAIANLSGVSPEASPVVAIRGRIAPVLAIHGASDTESPPSQAAALCDVVRAGGGDCGRLMVNGASHRVENWWPRHWGYKRRLVEWLIARVGDPGAPTSSAAPIERPSPRRAGRLRKAIVFDREERLTLDLWTPAGRGPFPLVMLAHGGGWEAGDRVTYITPLFEALARAGFAWCSIDYRLTPQVLHTGQLRDLRTALAFIRAQATALDLDASRIVLVGESASAQMVTLTAAADSRLAGVVSFYGVYDFAPMVTDASPRSLLARLFGRTTLDDAARATLRAYSPIHAVHRGMPPVLLVHGTNERLWDQGVAMAGALKRAGVPSELVRLEGAPHGMENWEGVDAWRFYKVRVVTWLRARFARPAPTPAPAPRSPAKS